MNCPFFKEQRVKFCSVAGFRKMILLDSADTPHEVCSGPAYPGCSLFGKAATGRMGSTGVRSVVCPSLHESLVQYCSAAAFQKFIPASEPRLLRCGRPGYRYCDLYRATVTTDVPAPGADGCIPAHLGYAPNHMWLDQIGPRQCQIGLDAFLAGLIGRVDQLTFLTVGGLCRPTVVLTIKGVDLRLAFPARVLITAANLYLRAEPRRLTADPYGAGWLFEGEPEAGVEAESKLILGTEAASWIEEESHRLGAWLHKRVTEGAEVDTFPLADNPGAAWMNDLSREDLMSLFDEFFSTDDTDHVCSSFFLQA